MSKRADEKDTLRPEYDLDKLTLIGWGSGYKRKPAVGQNPERTTAPRRAVHFKFRGQLICQSDAHEPSTSNDARAITCRNCLRRLKTK